MLDLRYFSDCLFDFLEGFSIFFSLRPLIIFFKNGRSGAHILARLGINRFVWCIAPMNECMSRKFFGLNLSVIPCTFSSIGFIPLADSFYSSYSVFFLQSCTFPFVGILRLRLVPLSLLLLFFKSSSFVPFEKVVDESEVVLCFVKDIVHDLLDFGWQDCQSVKSNVKGVCSS